MVHARLDGEALQRERFTKGLTHHQLARLVHVGAGERILGFERGAVEPNSRIILAMARALAVESMRLLLLPHGVDLEALRLASGRSPADMAQSVHVSLRSYLGWESGRSLPLENDRILLALTRALGCSSEQIVSALQNGAASEPGSTDGRDAVRCLCALEHENVLVLQRNWSSSGFSSIEHKGHLVGETLKPHSDVGGVRRPEPRVVRWAGAGDGAGRFTRAA